MFKKIPIFLLSIALILSGCSNESTNKTSKENNSMTNSELIETNGIEIEEELIEEELYDGDINRVGNSIGNIYNYGYVTQQGDWIYRADFKFYRESKDGTQKEELAVDIEKNPNGVFSDLNVVGEWLYFVHDITTGGIYNSFQQSSKLYRVRTNGSDLERLINDDVGEILVIDELIYFINYSDNNRIYKMNTDGSGAMAIKDAQGTWFQVIDDWLYYYNDKKFTLYKMKLDSNLPAEDIHTFSDSFYSLIMIIHDEILYYIDHRGEFTLYSLNMKTDEIRKLKNNVNSFNIKDNTIYYSDYNTGIYSMDLEGNNVKELSLDYAFCLELIDDWIYYGKVRMKTDGSNRERIDW